MSCKILCIWLLAASPATSPTAQTNHCSDTADPSPTQGPPHTFALSTPFSWHNCPLLSLTFLKPRLTYCPDFCLLGKLTEIFIHVLHLANNPRLHYVICLSSFLIPYLTNSLIFSTHYITHCHSKYYFTSCSILYYFVAVVTVLESEILLKDF